MAAGSEEGRKYLLGHLGWDARTSVDYFHDGTSLGRFPAHGDRHFGRFTGLPAVGKRVLDKDSQNLVKVLRVHQGEHSRTGVGSHQG